MSFLPFLDRSKLRTLFSLILFFFFFREKGHRQIALAIQQAVSNERSQRHLAWERRKSLEQRIKREKEQLRLVMNNPDLLARTGDDFFFIF